MTTNAAQTCRSCSGVMQQPGFWGLCAKCLYDESILAQKETEDRHTLVDRKFGDYELVRPLGRGGMGIVYEAIQVSLGRRVALKMILDADGASPEALRRFTLEAETVARLDHPNIVPLYQIGDVDGQPFLSMKLIPGETLRKKIAEGEFCLRAKDAELSREQFRDKLAATVRLLVKVARAVEHAHDCGILHRDLKPGNILVDPSDEPHLLDFGLAKIVRADALSGPNSDPNGAPGTPGYMSPEQVKGEPVTPASDIHSLGAIFYEMLCGAPAFSGASALEILKHVSEQIPSRPRSLNPRVDKDLDTICMKCLEKTPAARYPSARALVEDLERWLRHEPIRARPAGIPLRVTRWVARNRLGAALIASLCIGLTVALVFLRQTLDRQRKLDLRHANSTQRVSAHIQEMWKDPERRSIEIDSATLADLGGLSPRLIDSLSLPLVFGARINHEPFGQALQCAPFLHELESRMEKKLGRPVLIDLILYRFEADALHDLSRGKLQLQRMSPVAYVLAKKNLPGLHPLVRQRGPKRGVIFAKKNSGIANLADVAGKRLALGLSNSACAFSGKVYLARAGVRSSTFASCAYMAGEMDGAERPNPGDKIVDRDPNQQAHKRVVRQIFDGVADVGIVPERLFELSRYRKQGLVDLGRFDVPGDLYVAAANLSSDVVSALAECLLSFNAPGDIEVPGRIAEETASGKFENISDRDFDSIRAALEKEIADFENNRPQKPVR